MLKIPLDDSQRSFCEMEGDAIRLLAPAGSGKTLSLLWRCKKLVHDHRDTRILLFTYTRAARDELVTRLTLPQFCDIQRNVEITTLNSFGYQILKQNMHDAELMTEKRKLYLCAFNQLKPVWEKYPPLKRLYNSKLAHRTVKKVFELSDRLKSLGFRHDAHNSFDAFSGHLHMLAKIGMGLMLKRIFDDIASLEFIDRFDVKDLEILAIVRELSAEQLKMLHRLELKIFETYFKFWRESTAYLINKEMITLEDQKYVSRFLLRNKFEQGYRVDDSIRYQHILVDEFQDINPLDLALIKAIAGIHKTQVTIVGDDDQAIYEWRGATPAFILAPEKFFGHPYKTRILSTNYRSPANIVELSRCLIEHNQHRVPKAIKAASKDVAQIQVMTCDDVPDAIQKTSDTVVRLVKAGFRVAMISRKRSQLIPYQIVFASREIPFCAAEDLQIFLSETFQELKEILIVCSHKYDQKSYDFDPRADLLKLCDRIRRYPLSKADRSGLSTYLLGRNPQNLREACMYLREYHGPLKGDNSDARKSEEFAKKIALLFKAKTVSETLDVLSLEYEGLQKDFGKSDDDIFYADPPFLYLSELAKMYNSDFQRFIGDLERAVKTFVRVSDDDQNMEQWGRKLHLMTALRAKGKEFDAIFILDANQGIWPSAMAKTDSELEQERRLFYVAMTRARKRLTFVVDKTIGKKPAVPTQYLGEIGF